MKRDGRRLDHATLETIRLMAVERAREGEVASAVITSYGFNRMLHSLMKVTLLFSLIRFGPLHDKPAPAAYPRLRYG